MMEGARPKKGGVNDIDELEELRQENEELRDLLRRMRDPSVRMSSCRASKRDSKASRCSKGAAGSERVAGRVFCVQAPTERGNARGI